MPWDLVIFFWVLFTQAEVHLPYLFVVLFVCCCCFGGISKMILQSEARTVLPRTEPGISFQEQLLFFFGFLFLKHVKKVANKLTVAFRPLYMKWLWSFMQCFFNNVPFGWEMVMIFLMWLALWVSLSLSLFLSLFSSPKTVLDQDSCKIHFGCFTGNNSILFGCRSLWL